MVLIALGTYANSVPNGFAYDDPTIIEYNEVVTSGAVLGAFSSPYWPNARGGAGLYRPVTIASFAAQWSAFGSSPHGFHLVNVVLHAGVTLLGFMLFLEFLPPLFAAFGAAVFAVHPLHVEAVANVVGRSELLAAIFVLIACLIHLGEPGGPARRGVRWGGLVMLYFAGLGSKEIAVTLPGLLVLLTLTRDGWRDGLKKTLAEWPLYLLFSVGLATYLVIRGNVLGTTLGELPAPYFDDLTTLQRWLTAVSVWPEYLRLLVFPVDLVVEYGPAVLLPARTVDGDVLLGGLVGCVTGWLAVRSWRQARLVSLGLAWFALAILPVSNFPFPVGVLLAERTLYLPSLGFSFVLAGGSAWLVARYPGAIRALAVAASLALMLLCARTVSRNPAWMSTFSMLDTLSREHPESFLSLRARSVGLAAVGEYEEAARYYELALEMAPSAYSVLVEVGRFYGERENWQRAEELLERATQVFPVHPSAWQVRAEHLLLQGRGREGHSMALAGLRNSGPDRELWMLVSESYVSKGDFAASVRARLAALGVEPETSENWIRLAEILELDERPVEAVRARANAERVRATETLTENTHTHPLGVGGA